MTRIAWERYEGEDVEAVVAMLLSKEHPSSTRITPSTGDGGIDILDVGAAADGGDIVYQVKRHTRSLTGAQKRRAEESLKRALSDPRWHHRNFTEWMLVMPWDPTPEAERWLHTLGTKHGIRTKWHGLSYIDRLAAENPRIVREYLGEQLASSGREWGALPGEIRDLTTRGVESILCRLENEATPFLEFPSPETAEFLDGVGASQRSGAVSLAGLSACLVNAERRARDADVDGCTDVSGKYEQLVAPLSPFVTPESYQLDEVARALPACESRLTEVILETLEATKAQQSRANAVVGSDTEFQERHRFERLVAYGKGLLSLAEFIAPKLCEVNAAARGCLLITGPWGTGKSYQIARYAQREVNAGRPVLLLRARDFVDPAASIIGQRWWRAQLGAQNASDEDFMEALDAVGRWAEAPLTIAIDGLNESSLRDPAAAVQRLIALADRYQYVRVVITTRQDHNRQSYGDIPTFRHAAPERAVISRSLEHTLGIPPGTRWHAALTNPLLASIAARVIVGQDRIETATVAGSLSRVALLNAWSALLVSETSSRLGLPSSTAQALVDSVAVQGGTCAVRDAAKSSGVARDTADVVLNQLVDEGLLEWHTSVSDTVRFRWQGAGDMLAARIALERHPKTGAIGLLQGVPVENRLTTLDTIAETLPTLAQPTEILDLRLPSVTEEDQVIAFVQSLDGRPDMQITATTEKHARRILESGNGAADGIVWSVLAAPRRARLGLRWLNDQLRSKALSKRTVLWPGSLLQLSDASPSHRDALEALLTWYADTLIPEVTADDAANLIETLAWFACAPERSRLPAFAVASIVELVHAHPGALTLVGEQLKEVDDDHPRDALLNAASGVVSRWPASVAATIAREYCTRVANTRTAKSLRSVVAIHQVLAVDQPLHEFLRTILPPLPRPRATLPWVQMTSADRAMFADGRTDEQSQHFEARVWASFGVPLWRSLRFIAGRRDPATSLDISHGSELLRGRWLAHQYAHHPAGSRLWLGGHGDAKAGTPLNPGAEYATHPVQLWDFWVDPTIPLELCIRTSDHVNESTWWALDGGTSVVTVTDPDGVDWIVLHGGFRTLEPDSLADGDRRRVRIGGGGWWLNTDDGAPAAGLLRHDYLAVSHAQLTDAEDNDMAPFENARCRFGDLFEMEGSTAGALVHASMDSSADVPPPTATLLSLLDAAWTGAGIDCCDNSGALVITDPSSGVGLPRALLARRDSLETALDRQGTAITVNVRVIDNHSTRRFIDAPTEVVRLGPS